VSQERGQAILAPDDPDNASAVDHQLQPGSKLIVLADRQTVK
jgi:hypothetical protein